MQVLRRAELWTFGGCGDAVEQENGTLCPYISPCRQLDTP